MKDRRNSAFIISTVDILNGFQDSSVTNRIPSTILKSNMGEDVDLSGPNLHWYPSIVYWQSVKVRSRKS